MILTPQEYGDALRAGLLPSYLDARVRLVRAGGEIMYEVTSREEARDEPARNARIHQAAPWAGC